MTKFVKSFSFAAAVALLVVGVSVSAQTTTFTRDLTIGATGADVIALQDILIAGGYLTMPAGVSKGYFGELTKTAVMAWQAKVGLPATGYFGPMSKAKIAGTTTGTGSTGSTTGSTSGLEGGDGDIANISETTSGTETTLGEGKTEDVLGFDLEADDNSDLDVTSIKVEIATEAGESSRLSRYLDTVAITVDGEEVGSVDASDFKRNGATSTATIALDDAMVEAGEEVRFYVTLTAAESINDSERDATVNVAVSRVRVEDASGAVLTDNITDDISATVEFEDSTANDDAKIKSSTDTRDAGLVKVEDNKTSEDFDILTFKIDVDEDSSDLVVTSIPVVLRVTNASSTEVLNIESLIDDLWIEVDGEKYDDFDYETDHTVGTSTSEEITATFTIDEGDLEIAAGDVVDAVVYVTFAEQPGNYAEGSKIYAKVTGSQIDSENTEGDNFVLSGITTGKEQTVQISAATVENFAWKTTKTTYQSSTTALFTFTFKVTADDEDFVFDQSSLSLATSTTGTATTSGLTWAITSGADVVGTDGSEYTVTEGEDATFQVSFTATGSGSVSATATSVAGQEVPSDKQYSGLEAF